VKAAHAPANLIRRGVRLAFIIIVVGTSVCRAQVWSGGGADGNWTTGQNWVANLAPVSGPSTQIHFQGAVRPASFADSNSPWVLNRIDFDLPDLPPPPTSFFISGNQLSFRGTSPQIHISASAAQTINNDIDIAEAGLTVNGSNAHSLTLNGHISGLGGLTVAEGQVFLTNSNSYAGTTRLGISPTYASVTISNGQALGASGTGGVIVGGACQVRLSGGITVSNKSLALSTGSGNSNGLMNVAGNNAWTGPISLSGAASFWSLSPGENLTVSGDIEGNNNAMQMGGLGDIVVSGAIRNLHWGLSKYGTGTLTLAGNNSNINQIVVADGTLIASHSTALPLNTSIQLNPSSYVPLQDAHPTLRIEEDATIAGLSGQTYGGNGTVHLGSHTLTVSQAYFSNYAGAFVGSGTVVKAGTGTLELTGVSDHTGGTVVTGGALCLGQDRALGAVPAVPTVSLTIEGGELQPSPGAPLTLNANRTILLQGPASMTSFSTAPLTLPGQVTGPGTLSKVGLYAVILSNPNNNYSGGTFINAGTLRFDVPGAIAPLGKVKISSGAIAAAGYPIDQTFLSRIDPISSGIIALGVNSANDLDFDALGLSNVFLAAIGTQSYGGSMVAPDGGYRLGGLGTITLTKENALSGKTSLHTGVSSSPAGRVILSNNNSIKGDTVVHGGTLEVNASTLTCNQLKVESQATLQLVGGTVATDVIVNAMGSLRGCGTISGSLTNNGSVIVNCAPGLTATGSITNNGTMILLDGANLVAGGSFINNGFLDLLTSPGTILPPGFVNNGTVIFPGEVKVRSVSKSGTLFSLSVQSFSGHNYQLQRNSTLGDSNWQDVGTPAAGTGADITLIDSTAAPQQFYRIQVAP
jgi:fibronectin-binding autotransporter adhesin